MTPHFLIRAFATAAIVVTLTVLSGASTDTGPERVTPEADHQDPPARSLLFSTLWWSNTFDIYDGTTLARLSSLVLEPYCGGISLSADKQKAYVGCWNGNHVAEVDISNPEAPSLVRWFPAGRLPVAVAAVPDGSKVFVVNRNDGDLTIIHLNQGGMTTRLAVPGAVGLYHVAVAPDSRRAYVSSWGQVHVVDVATGAVVDSIVLQTQDSLGPGQLVVSADSRTLYVADGNAGVLAKVDLQTREFQYRYGTSQHGDGVAVTRDESRAYMAHSNTGGRVSIFDLRDFRLVGFVGNLSGVYAGTVRLSDDAGCLYIRSQNWIDIVRTSDHLKVARIAAGGGPGNLEANGVPSGLCAARRPAVLSWAPSDLLYGDPLGAAQFNATSDVEGTFQYSPAPGALLPAGSHQLCATFTPADTTRYDGSTVCRDITVHRASILMRVTGGTFDFDGLPHAATVEASGPLGPVGPVAVTYWRSGDAVESSEAPAAVGSYVVRAIFAGDQNHNPAVGDAVVRIRAACAPVTDGAGARLTTLFGGNGFDTGRAIDVAADGSVVAAGFTRSTDLLTTTGAHQRTLAGNADAWVAKFRPDGSLMFSTYVGGTGHDDVTSVVALADGRTAVYGYTESANFPVTEDASQPTFGGGVDVFVAVLSPTGALLYSTYFGGPHKDWDGAMAVDPQGRLVVTGTTGGALITTPGAVQAPAMRTSVFVARFQPSVPGAAGLQGVATIGGDDWDHTRSIAVDQTGRIYVVGNTESSDFPVTANALQSTSGGFCAVNWPDCGDAFLTVLSADLTSILFSTYIGTGSDTTLHDVAVDTQGSVYAAGRSYSGALGFAATPRRPFSGEQDALVIKLRPFAATVLDYVTFVGGTGSDVGQGLSVDGAGRVTVAGTTYSTDFPVTTGAPDMGEYSGHAADSPMLFDLDESGDLRYANFAVAGRNHGNVAAGGLATGPDGQNHLVGTSPSTRFPTSSCGYDDHADGLYDAFIVSLAARRVSPDVVWAPGPMTYGEPLGDAQLNATASTAGTFSYSPAAGAILGAGTHTVTVTFTPTDAARYFTVTRNAEVNVAPASLIVTAPTLSREFGTDNPPLSATFTGFVNGEDVSGLSGTLSVSTTATVTSPVGAYPISVSGVTSPNYEIGFVTGTLNAVDTTAPMISELRPSEATLWAPNHRMVPITVFVTATDATSPAACAVVSVSTNEAVNGLGDGDSAPDWAITGPLSVQLRAERAGAGSGRIYTLRVQCQDAYGNTASASTTVTVPQSRK